jgi:hypothetical protein
MVYGIPQNDPRLLEYIRKEHIIPPPSKVPYNLRHKGRSSKKNTLIVHHLSKLLANKVWLNMHSLNFGIFIYKKNLLFVLQTNGFFVEYRAYDGELHSKTLFFERHRNWTGLLIEPDPHTFSKLLSKRRRAWLSDSCLSPDPVPLTIEFMRRIMPPPQRNHSAISTSIAKNSKVQTTETVPPREPVHPLWQKIQIPCFPMFSIVSSVFDRNFPITIDYFSVDAQGMELQILLNIPWNSIVIKVCLMKTQCKLFN